MNLPKGWLNGYLQLDSELVQIDEEKDESEIDSADEIAL